MAPPSAAHYGCVRLVRFKTVRVDQAAISDGSSIVLPGGRVLHFIRGDYVIFDELYGCHPNQPDTGVRWSIDQIKRSPPRPKQNGGFSFSTASIRRITSNLHAAMRMPCRIFYSAWQSFAAPMTV
ncbi:MAG: hypothetical protein WB760_05715 [Xanthobacteraceae bacterium]